MDWQSALDGRVAWDGWVGAVVGALASILLAVGVLLVTLNSEKKRSKENLAQERDLSAKQLEQNRVHFQEQLRRERAMGEVRLQQDRELALEQRRMEAFADLCGELLSFEGEKLSAIPVLVGGINAALRPTLLAYHRWSLYCGLEHDTFRRAVNRGIYKIRKAAERASQRMDPQQIEAMFSAEEGSGMISWLISKGREWHLDQTSRSEIEARIVEKFPEMPSVDPDTGQVHMV